MNPVSPNDLLVQLDDIKGLDHIGWWPPAPGWIALFIVLLLVAAWLAWRRWRYWHSWKGDAMRSLRNFDMQLSAANAREIAAGLSAWLRRVAIRRASRAECAGLEGEAWLTWLTAKDPGKFDWARRGALLIEAPYAPPGRDYPPGAVKPMLDAAKRWVK